MHDFHDISARQYDWSPQGVILRMIDGLGFRLYWACDGLSADDFQADPGHEAMSIGAQVKHIRGMMLWIANCDDKEDYPDPRAEMLGALTILRNKVAAESFNSEDLRLREHDWQHVINGPLADALTHVGQINLIRRQYGKPVPAHNRFLGSEV